jgi:hypothetical protein
MVRVGGGGACGVMVWYLGSDGGSVGLFGCGSYGMCMGIMGAALEGRDSAFNGRGRERRPVEN